MHVCVGGGGVDKRKRVAKVLIFTLILVVTIAMGTVDQ